MLEVAVFNSPLNLRQLFFSLLRVVMEESPGLLPPLFKFVVVKSFVHHVPECYRRHFYGFKQV